MLRLFSNIRKTLINEGKTSRYVRYAVGEFLLIVAGILVALQIQNWNEGRKLGQERRELIEDLKVDFQTNLERLGEIIPVGTNRIEKTKLFLEIAGGSRDGFSTEEINQLAEEAYSGFRFRTTLPNYEAAVSTGIIKLLGSPQLNKLFIQIKQIDDDFQIATNLSFQDATLGGGYELRRRLGSHGILYLREAYNPPAAFDISDQEFRHFLAQKEVYAVFENLAVFHNVKLEHLIQMRDLTQQILTALESLDK